MVRWKCKDCQREWMALRNKRSSRTGCVPCKKQASIKKAVRNADREKLIACLFPELAQEWIRPVPKQYSYGAAENTTSGSNLYVLWKCNMRCCEWEAIVSSRAINGNGCYPCAKKKTSLDHSLASPDNALLALYPTLSQAWVRTVDKQYSYLTPETINSASGIAVLWRCQGCLHEWEAVVGSRTKQKGGCPPCSLAWVSLKPLQELFSSVDPSYLSSHTAFVKLLHTSGASQYKGKGKAIVKALIDQTLPLSTVQSIIEEKLTQEMRQLVLFSRPSNQRSISRKIRKTLLERDGDKCVCCGRTADQSGHTLHIDHKIPYSLGGNDRLENLWFLCQRCNTINNNKMHLSLEQIRQRCEELWIADIKKQSQTVVSVATSNYLKGAL